MKLIYMKCFFYTKQFFLFSGFFYLSFSQANEQWMAARNLKEFKQIIQKQERGKELKTLCFLQLQKKQVPYSCYEWLAPGALKETALPLQYLNENCERSSVHLKSLLKIKKILQQKSLSSFCRKKIKWQKKRIEYQLRDYPLSDIFTWYFKEDF